MIVVAALAAGAFVWGKYLWKPLVKGNAELRNRIAELEKKIQKAMTVAARREKIMADLTRLNEEVVEAEKVLRRESAESPGRIMDWVENKARANRVEINELSPAGEQFSAYHKTHRFEISALAREEDLRRFLDPERWREDPLCAVKDLRLGPPDRAGRRLVRFQLLVFTYKG